jgi:endoglucanase
MRTIAVAACVIAALALPGAPARSQPSGPAPQALWQAYKQRFIAPEGRLVDDSAKSVSHSEGQGYAMLLAAFAADDETFARLWAWTSANLEIRGDGLAAWRWRPQDEPHVLDKNNATDGDLLIAWALAEGGREWKNKEYTRQARRIALAIAAHAAYPAIFGTALSPGASGFGPDDRKDGPIVNLSYWVFPAFKSLAEVAPEVDWPRLEQSGLALIDGARFGPRRLPSDWISLKYGIQPAEDFPRRFGYDAIRIPLYLAWGAPGERARLADLVDGWTGGEGDLAAVVDIDSGAAVEPLAEKGYLAVVALGRCAAHGVKFPDSLREVDFDRYYPATLHMLALAALRQRHPEC